MSLADFPSPAAPPPVFLKPSAVYSSLLYSVLSTSLPPNIPFLFSTRSRLLSDVRVLGSFALYSMVYPSLSTSTLYEEYLPDGKFIAGG